MVKGFWGGEGGYFRTLSLYQPDDDRDDALEKMMKRMLLLQMMMIKMIEMERDGGVVPGSARRTLKRHQASPGADITMRLADAMLAALG
jgi:hypothetical protein